MDVHSLLCLEMYGIDICGWWKIRCGRHPYSAERVEELEESVLLLYDGKIKFLQDYDDSTSYRMLPISVIYIITLCVCV